MEEYWKGELTCKTGGVGGPVENMDFSYLIGGKILHVGFHLKAREGGLTIDYEKDEVEKRVVFGFNELGIWKEWEGVKGSPSELDLLLFKIEEAIDKDSWCYIDKLEEDPLKRCFRFITDNGQDILDLNVGEIKLLSKSIRNLFKEPKKNLDEIIGSFELL